MRISRQAFILVMEDWFMAWGGVDAGIPREMRALYPLIPDGSQPVDAICALLEPLLMAKIGHAGMLPIWKSNYLYRRLYKGQAHRVNPCPTCKGRWGHLLWVSGCRTCGSTGWLP